MKVNLSEAIVYDMGSKLKSTDGPKSWQWRTPRRSSYTSFPTDSIVPLLREYEMILPALNQVRAFSHFHVTIICEFNDNESPCGFSFSRETIELLSKFQASVEIDSVSRMSPPEI